MGWNLPPGCTQRDIDRAYGQPDEQCAGCGEDLREEDTAVCYVCRRSFCANNQCESTAELDTPTGTDIICLACRQQIAN